MVIFLTIIHVLVCFFLILVVLLQAGKGGGMGVAFGSGTSAAVFGGRGAGSFLEKLTAGSAIVFMLTSMSLAVYSSQSDSKRLQREGQKVQKQQSSKAASDAKVQDQAAERAKIPVPPAAPTPASPKP